MRSWSIHRDLHNTLNLPRHHRPSVVSRNLERPPRSTFSFNRVVDFQELGFTNHDFLHANGARRFGDPNSYLLDELDLDVLAL